MLNENIINFNFLVLTMNNNNNDEWIHFAKQGLDWLIKKMGCEEWYRRRQNVADYFHQVKILNQTKESIEQGDLSNEFSPIAIYNDWMSWYMYLVESVFERQGCDDPFQSSRIYPFFVTIGRDIDALESMKGIEDKLKIMFNEKQNKPDSTLYELAVALLYHRNGWYVEFLPESIQNKTPDLQITKNSDKYWVECKRVAKVNDYAEKERLEWQKRLFHLMNAMQMVGRPAFSEVIFKVPIDQVKEHVLASAYLHYITCGFLEDNSFFSTEEIDFRISWLNLEAINEELKGSSVKPNSPFMIKLITGDYHMDGNYSLALKPSLIESVNPDNKLYVLNDFYGGVHSAYAAKWDCIAEESTDRKANNLRRKLIDAVEQIPQEGKGIIHIGYETVTGSEVEIRREEKIKKMINEFDFRSKNIVSLYFNSMQFLTDVNLIDWEETTIRYEQFPDAILKDLLLFDVPDTKASDAVHWKKD